MSEEAAGGTTQPATIVVLPDELWLHLLAFLKEQDVVSLHFVNRHLYRLAEDDAVWRALFVAKYPEQLHDRALARHGWKERLRLVHACWHHGKFAVRHSLATHTRFGGIRFANFAEDDENLIVGGSTQGHIVIWNLDKEPSSESNRDSTQDDTTDPSVEHIAAHSQWVRCVIRRGDTLFSCSSDNTIKIWSLSTKQMVHNLTAHTNQVNLVKLMPDLAGSVADSTTLLSASDDNTIGQWDIERGVCVRTFDGHTGWVLALDCDANTIVSAGSVQPINIWDARSGSRRSIPCGSVVRFLQFDDNTLALCGDSLLQIWDLRMNEKPVKELPQPDTLWTLQLSGSRLLTGGDHSDMHLWDINTGTCRVINDPAADPTPSVQSLQFSATRIVSASLAGRISVWGPDYGQP